MKTIITKFEAKAEGVVLKTNVPSKLKKGNVRGTTFFVSWDRIGELLFDNYTEETSVEGRDKLRNQQK